MKINQDCICYIDNWGFHFDRNDQIHDGDDDAFYFYLEMGQTNQYPQNAELFYQSCCHYSFNDYANLAYLFLSLYGLNAVFSLFDLNGLCFDLCTCFLSLYHFNGKLCS